MEKIIEVPDTTERVATNNNGMVTVMPLPNGASVKFQPSTEASKTDNYIIISPNLEGFPGQPLYWSEEEGGRFSGGPLYEKTFKTRGEAEDYIEQKKIDGIAVKHSTHWTGGMPMIYDSGKPAGTIVSKN